MPPILTQVARSADALPLVATSTPTHNLVVTSQHQQDAKKLLRSMTADSPKMSITGDDGLVFYYMARDNLCFLTLCEATYPKRLGFLYLEEVADALQQELVKEFASNASPILACVILSFVCVSLSHTLSLQWRNEVDQASRPFQFIRYDPIIQRKQREFRDASQQQSRLAEDLTEIQSIMKKNIDEILNRGEKLDHVSDISSELRNKSKDFKWGAKKLTWQARLQQYGPMAVGALIVLVVIYVKVWHIGF